MLQLVPVMWRLHAWALSGMGISKNQGVHYAKRTAALARFAAHFGEVGPNRIEQRLKAWSCSLSCGL